MIKKKVLTYFLALIVVICAIPMFTASAAADPKYVGGLLDGVTMQKGTAIGSSTGTETKITDGDFSASVYLGSNQIVWYTFATPQTVSALIAKYAKDSIYYSPPVFMFYDNNDNLLGSYVSLFSDGIETLPNAITNVSTVVITNQSANSYVYEANLFASPLSAPAVSEITWIQAGDSVVDLHWKHVGAESYTVKRSTSPSGPFSTLQTNVQVNFAGDKSVSYTDNTVTNGTTYYYVISSVNSAGASLNSASASITPSKTKFTNGLLDRVELDWGSTVGSSTKKTRKVTNNNAGDYEILNASGDNVLYHSFSTPQTINSVITSYMTLAPVIEFYDAAGDLLTSYTPLNSGNVESLPAAVQNVSTIVLRVPSGVHYIYEWNVFSTPSAPPSVTTINWVQGHDTTVDLYWNNVGAKSYIVKRSTTTGGPYATIKSDLTGTSYTDNTVVNGTKYYYVVIAKNEAGTSNSSVEVSVTPSASKYTGGLLDRLGLGYDISVSSNPTATIRATTDNNVSTNHYISSGYKLFNTFPVPKDIKSVIVNYSGNEAPALDFFDKDGNLITTFVPSTSDVAESLGAPVESVTTVVARTRTGNAIMIKEWNLFGEDHPAPPVAPSNLTAAGGNRQVTLNWNAVNNAMNGYEVKRSTTAGGPYTSLTTVPTGTTSYIDTTAVNGTTYYYVVIAKNALGASPASNEASAKPMASGGTGQAPTEPTNLTAVGGNQSITLHWDPVPGATGYVIKRTTDLTAGFNTIVATVGPTPTSYTDTTVTNGTKYYYVVQAFSGEDYSDHSNQASATPGGSVVTPPVETGDRAILEIMLSNGELKEYDVPMSVATSFVVWYETRAAGQGPVTFAIDRSNNNKGPFANRKDYIIYDKIIMFEVNAYDVPDAAPPSNGGSDTLDTGEY